MFEAVEIISNPLPEPAEVWFEPWGMPHPLAPGQSFRVVAVSSQPGKLEIEQDGTRIIVYAWTGSTMRVYSGDRLVDDFSVEVPDLPPGESTRSFLEVVFEGSAGPGVPIGNESGAGKPEANSVDGQKGRKRGIHYWVRRGFILWAVVSTAYLANTMRTRGVPETTLLSDAKVSVADRDETLEFVPSSTAARTGLVFLCGSGVAAHAYAPMLRPIAEAGYPVYIVKLPYRFAPRESDKRAAIDRAIGLTASHPEIGHWVVSGHSLGGALSCRTVLTSPGTFSAMVLLGTTHPKNDDLSSLAMPVTKVFATNDGVAPADRTLSNKRLLPEHTRWVKIEGGNHSQFGHYGHQLFDGTATVSHDSQQDAARSALLAALIEAGS